MLSLMQARSRVFALCFLVGLIAALGTVLFLPSGGRPAEPAAPVSIPPSSARSEFTVVAVGDIACSASTRITRLINVLFSGCKTPEVATLIGRLNPDAFLTLGDNQYPDGSAVDFTYSYDRYFGAFKSITSPSPGNHDYGTRDAVGYFSYFGERAGDPAAGYYSRSLGSWLLISLNSNCDGTIDCSPQSPQVQWLGRVLRENTERCILAFWHHPRYSSGAHGGNETVQSFWDVLYQYSADLVLNGHDHTYERFAPMNPVGEMDTTGIRQFVVGTGGMTLYGKLRSEPNSEAFENRHFGVLALTLMDGTYDWKFISINDSNVIDQGTAHCH